MAVAAETLQRRGGGLHPGRGGEVGVVPAQRPVARGEFEELGGGEGHRDNDEGGKDEEQQDGGAEGVEPETRAMGDLRFAGGSIEEGHWVGLRWCPLVMLSEVGIHDLADARDEDVGGPPTRAMTGERRRRVGARIGLMTRTPEDAIEADDAGGDGK